MIPVRLIVPHLSRDSAVGTVTRLRAGVRASKPVVARNFPLLQMVQTGSGIHPVSYYWMPVFSPEIKRPGCEVHPPQSSNEIMNKWSYTSTSPACLHGVKRDNFTFTFTVPRHVAITLYYKNQGNIYVENPKYKRNKG